MHRSFAFRLSVAFAAVGLVGAVLTAALVNAAFGGRFAGYLDARQDERLEVVLAALEESYDRHGGWDPAELQQIASVALMDGGTVTMATPTGDRQLWSVEAGPLAELHRRMMGTGPLARPLTRTVEVAGEVVGVATLELPEPGLLPADVSFRRSINQLLGVAVAVAGLVALLTGVAVARHTTAPARALTRAAQAMAGGDRDQRVAEARDDEFGQMAVAFNRLADTVDAEDRLRRGFAADVAHELRTPLMILRGEIEAMQDGMVQPTPAALESLRQESARLARLVEDLQTVSRADAAGFVLDRRLVDLCGLAAATAEDLASTFVEEGVELTVAAPSEVMVRADPVRVRQIATNLLINAVRFSPRGAITEIMVTRERDDAVLAVSNTGPAIPADEQPRVFERFFRGRRAQAGGSGIGLAVVRQLALAHGGDAAVVSTPERTTFTVRLPIA